MTERIRLLGENPPPSDNEHKPDRRVRIVRNRSTVERRQLHDDMEVGYKKPPKSTRFKPGQSGNPRGRPKGEPNLSTAIEKELRSVIVVQEGGSRPKRITKTSAIAKRFVNKAVSGDPKAISKLIDRDGLVSSKAGMSPKESASPFSEPAAQAAKSEVLASFIDRLRSSLQLEQESQPPSSSLTNYLEKNVDEIFQRPVRRRADPDDL